MKYKDGNLFESGADFICHQVNCKGVMGAGIARQLRDKHPEVYEYYHNYCESNNACELSSRILGDVLLYPTDQYTVVNIFGQDNYGRDGLYTDYDAFRDALNGFKKYLLDPENEVSPNAKIGFPLGIGCGLAGGDWSIISELIAEFDRQVPQQIIIYKYRRNG